MGNILAIDPGTTQSAYVLMSRNGVIIDKAIVPNSSMLNLCGLISYGEAVIEMVASYGMPVGREVFETCVWIGEFKREIFLSRSVEARLVYRKDIKLHLCGSAKAKDANIRQALIDLLGPPGTKKNPGPTYGFAKDTWAALAVAVYHRDTKNKC